MISKIVIIIGLILQVIGMFVYSIPVMVIVILGIENHTVRSLCMLPGQILLDVGKSMEVAFD